MENKPVYIIARGSSSWSLATVVNQKMEQGYIPLQTSVFNDVGDDPTAELFCKEMILAGKAKASDEVKK